MSSARFAQCYLCSLEVLRGVSHGATEVGAGGRGRRSPFHQQQRRTGICLQLALDLPDGTMAATMTTNKPPQNPSRRGQSELIPLTQQECADCRACCPSALFPRVSWLVVIAAIIAMANPSPV